MVSFLCLLLFHPLRPSAFAALDLLPTIMQKKSSQIDTCIRNRHTAVWNIVGSIGFLLCGLFGFDSVHDDWKNRQSILSTLWGSSAFLVSCP